MLEPSQFMDPCDSWFHLTPAIGGLDRYTYREIPSVVERDMLSNTSDNNTLPWFAWNAYTLFDTCLISRQHRRIVPLDLPSSQAVFQSASILTSTAAASIASCLLLFLRYFSCSFADNASLSSGTSIQDLLDSADMSTYLLWGESLRCPKMWRGL